jgi:hypothetical protein
VPPCREQKTRILHLVGALLPQASTKVMNALHLLLLPRGTWLRLWS